jgi:hypothetical protein
MKKEIMERSYRNGEKLIVNQIVTYLILFVGNVKQRNKKPTIPVILRLVSCSKKRVKLRYKIHVAKLVRVKHNYNETTKITNSN